MASKQLVFKASVEAGKEIRKFTFPDPSVVDYAELRLKLATLFNLASFRIRYKNSQGHYIVIGNEKEMRQALADILSCSDFDKVIIRLVLDQTTATADNEPRNLNKAEERPAASNDDKRAKTGDAGTTTFESVLNAGIRGFHEMVETLVNQQPVPNTSSASGATVSTTSGTSFAHDPANVNITSPRNDADTRKPVPTTSIASGVNVPASNGIGSALDPANVNIKSPKNDADSANTKQPVPKTSSASRANVTTSNRTRSVSSRTTTQEAPREPTVHYGVICDCCERRIEGMRWKCKMCADYDLCDDCKPKVDVHKHNADHAFETIRFPAGRSCIPRTSLSHNAVCDYCDAVIVGIRHKCIHCPDFDLCNSCIDLAPTEHPTHTFMPIHQPGEPEIRIPDAIYHPGIRCDGCTKSINGIRYKCGNCPDFDLCGNCEASPFYNHDPDHILLKIKRPIVNQMLSRAPLLPNFYVRSDLRTQRPKSFSQRPEQKPSVQEVASQTNHESIESLTHAATQEAKEGSQSEPVTSPTVSVVSQSRGSSQSSVEEERPVSRAPIALYESNPLDKEIAQLSPTLEASSVIAETLQSVPVIAETSQSSPKLESEPVTAETSQSSLPILVANAEKLATLQPCLEELNNLFKPQYSPKIAPYSIIDSLELEPIPVTDSIDILPKMSDTFKAEFVEDVNIPQNTPLAAQAQFVKIWKMRNNGSFAWPKTTVLKCVGGLGSAPMFDESLASEGKGPEFPVGVVQPGETVEVMADDLQAPAEPGTYSSYWRLNDGAGNFLGPRIWCQIVVQAADETSSLASSSVIFPVLTQTASSSVPTSIYRSDIDDINADTPAPFREPESLNVTAVLDDQLMTQSIPPPTAESEAFVDSDSDSYSDSSFLFVESDEENEA